MKILAIETATARCSAALMVEEDMFVLRQESPGPQSGQVLGMMRDLLRQQDLRGSDLDLVAVDIGPGSFTGLRVGIGVAQGFAYSHKLPIVGVGSLAALAICETQRPVIAALDARMQQVYWAVFQDGDVTVEPQVSDPEQMTLALNGREWLDAPIGVGDGWAAYADRMPQQMNSQPLEILGDALPEAGQIARLAQAVSADNYQSPLTLSAAYVRNNVAKKSAH